MGVLNPTNSHPSHPSKINDFGREAELLQAGFNESRGIEAARRGAWRWRPDAWHCEGSEGAPRRGQSEGHEAKFAVDLVPLVSLVPSCTTCITCTTCTETHQLPAPRLLKPACEATLLSSHIDSGIRSFLGFADAK